MDYNNLVMSFNTEMNVNMFTNFLINEYKKSKIRPWNDHNSK